MFTAFRQQFAAEFDAIDRRCETFMVREAELGTFSGCPDPDGRRSTTKTINHEGYEELEGLSDRETGSQEQISEMFWVLGSCRGAECGLRRRLKADS